MKHLGTIKSVVTLQSVPESQSFHFKYSYFHLFDYIYHEIFCPIDLSFDTLIPRNIRHNVKRKAFL